VPAARTPAPLNAESQLADDVAVRLFMTDTGCISDLAVGGTGFGHPSLHPTLLCRRSISADIAPAKRVELQVRMLVGR
jgi:hypothetical protein